MANDWLSLSPLPFLTQWIAVFFPPELSLHINTVVTVSQGRGLGVGLQSSKPEYTHNHTRTHTDE